MNKHTILKETTEIEIYKFYLGISEVPKGNISSPFSEDRNPSFKLYKNGTFKCHSTGRQGDVWQFVADLNDLDVKTEFHRVLHIIAKDFGIKDEQKHFSYTTKSLEQYHLDYWSASNWNVTREYLDQYCVRALDKFEYFNTKTQQIEKRKIFDGIAAFVYEINNRAELYIPKQAKANKFLMNKTIGEDIFGLQQLPDQSPFIVVAAGKKDTLILNSNNIPAVCFRSENHTPSPAQIEMLKSKCDNLLICYDNDEPGQLAMNKICKRYKLVPIRIPSEFNDIADFLAVYFPSRFTELLHEAIELAETEKEEKKGTTIFHITEEWLSKRYSFRYNTIALDIECRKKGFSNWEVVNEDSLYIELQKAGVKCSIQKLLSILRSDFVPHFNPLVSYFEDLPAWNGVTDYIEALASYVKPIDRKQFNYHFKKWLVRSVRCAIEAEYFNKQAFVFVQRGQNTGKSTFCRFLCPPKLGNYIAEDISQDKDARIMLCKNFLINLDELAGLNKRELESLKSIFSKTKVKERLPYDRKASTIARTCSFVGSTNEYNFLSDSTGSVRWLCFRIKSIDWDYSKKINIDQVWSQAYHLATHSFDCELSYDDILKNEERNRNYQILSTEQELISRYVKPMPKGKGQFVTASDILVKLSQSIPGSVRLNKIQVGKALRALGFSSVTNSTLQRKGYWVKFLSFDEAFDRLPDDDFPTYTAEDYGITEK